MFVDYKQNSKERPFHSSPNIASLAVRSRQSAMPIYETSETLEQQATIFKLKDVKGFRPLETHSGRKGGECLSNMHLFVDISSLILSGNDRWKIRITLRYVRIVGTTKI
jgi:hypothetical protein